MLNGQSILDTTKLITGKDGQSARQVYRNCIPDGSVDLMKLTPSDIIKRSWSFRVNYIPEMMESFTLE